MQRTPAGLILRLAPVGLLLALGLGLSSSLLGQPVQRTETRVFPLSAGELVVVENDYGSIKVRGADVTQAQVRLKRKVSREERLREVELITAKAADRLFLKSFFFDYQGESVEFDIEVPHGVRVVVWGANPQVEVEELDDYVRVQTMTGDVLASNLTGSVSLLSESGDIDLRLRRQPAKDLRLESVRGRVKVEASPDINLFAYVRAGGVLSWGEDIEMRAGKLSREIGDGAGPLLYASSLEGDVSLLPGAGGSSIPRRVPSPPVVEDRDDRDRQGYPGSGQSDQRSDDPYGGSYDPDNRRVDNRRGAPPTLGEEEEGNQPSQSDQSSGGSTPEYTVAGPDEEINGAPLFRSSVNLIHLNVAVTDRRNNRSVAHLRENDFSVYEDGRLQEIERFQNTEAPFNLLLLLDISGSTKNHIDLIRDASIDFTREIKSNDRIAVATFNDRVRLIQDFTNDRYEVANSIHRIRSNGGTHFYDALYVSVNEYLAGVEGRKAVVVFTDGVDGRLSNDPGSRVSFRQLYRSVQEVDTTIYTIFLDTRATVGGSPQSTGIGDIVGVILGGGRGRRIPGGSSGSVNAQYEEARRQLEMIADQTGGRLYQPRTIHDLSTVYSEIADDLRVQYSLAYSSSNPNQDGSWRSIRVDVSGRDLVARTRKGYYATPTSADSQGPNNRFVPQQ
ncbi:MAG TPA: VWA domain-containing protein [Acidobacteriota bacterium]|nr:VWA domain-containing protein [Acidobacteriota bacterium]